MTLLIRNTLGMKLVTSWTSCNGTCVEGTDVLVVPELKKDTNGTKVLG